MKLWKRIQRFLAADGRIHDITGESGNLSSYLIFKARDRRTSEPEKVDLAEKLENISQRLKQRQREAGTVEAKEELREIRRHLGQRGKKTKKGKLFPIIRNEEGCDNKERKVSK